MKKNIKTIIGLLIAFIIGISTTVGAATVFNSKDITYSSDKTTKKNVKDSLDELYTKAASAGQCPNGYYCHKTICPDGYKESTDSDGFKTCKQIKLISAVKIGSYISMTPTSTSYTISKDLTGSSINQTINPSELNLWRVIRKNSDGTVDVVSEYISTKRVSLFSEKGFNNYVGVLNTIAAQYTDGKHVASTRHMGYSDQQLTCSGISCPSDTGHEIDVNLVNTAIGTLIASTIGGDKYNYFLASRRRSGNLMNGYYVSSGGVVSDKLMYNYSGGSGSITGGVRPILTLKADVEIASGDGKSASTAYQLA